MLVLGLHGNAVISFYDLEAPAHFSGDPMIKLAAHILESFAELLLEKVGVFLE